LKMPGGGGVAGVLPGYPEVGALPPPPEYAAPPPPPPPPPRVWNVNPAV
ncbi:hypothetical protein ABIC78_004012, partial [Novosphingobium sp. 1529]